MKLYLVQHGQAVDKSIDPDRPLSDEGRKDVQTMADFLKTADVRPKLFFHSGKTRAQQTAEILASALKDAKPKFLQDIKPNDPLKPACGVINGLSDDTMIVGHLPYMQRMVSFLLNINENAGYHFLPGSVVCLNNIGDSWEMEWMVRPDIIPAQL